MQQLCTYMLKIMLMYLSVILMLVTINCYTTHVAGYEGVI